MIDDATPTRCSTATVLLVAYRLELLLFSLALSHVARWLRVLLTSSFNVFLVSFSSCFDWFLMWYRSQNNFTQVNLNTSLTRFQSSELPSYRVFCSKCGSFVAMDYGEWTILISEKNSSNLFDFKVKSTPFGWHLDLLITFLKVAIFSKLYHSLLLLGWLIPS